MIEWSLLTRKAFGHLDKELKDWLRYLEMRGPGILAD